MKVKICGLTTEAAVETAVENGADFLGFVFAKSRRQISPAAAAALTKDLSQNVEKVGVFVSPTLEEIKQTVEIAGLDFIQIHGKLPANLNSKVPIIRAVHMEMANWLNEMAAETFDYLLLDAPPQEFVGGNGQVFDWQQVDPIVLKNRKVIIAGGLTAANVQEAIQYFQPYGVDVSSGVETDGKKDLQKIREFIKAAKLTAADKNDSQR